MGIAHFTFGLLAKCSKLSQRILLVAFPMRNTEYNSKLTEPERAPTLHAARVAGQPVDVDVSGIAADSLGAKRIGAIAWEVSQRHVQDALLLPDDAIRAAQLWLWRELKLAVEPAAALGLAALQTGVYRPQPQETVGLVLCGANFDPASLG